MVATLVAVAVGDGVESHEVTHMDVYGLGRYGALLSGLLRFIKLVGLHQDLQDWG